MIQHTLIISTPKIERTENVTPSAIHELIRKGLTTIDYFGLEIDNQADFIDDEMQAKIDKFIFIDIYFETEEVIDYQAKSELEIYKYYYALIENPKGEVFNADEQNIFIYSK